MLFKFILYVLPVLFCLVSHSIVLYLSFVPHSLYISSYGHTFTLHTMTMESYIYIYMFITSQNNFFTAYISNILVYAN